MPTLTPKRGSTPVRRTGVEEQVIRVAATRQEIESVDSAHEIIIQSGFS